MNYQNNETIKEDKDQNILQNYSNLSTPSKFKNVIDKNHKKIGVESRYNDPIDSALSS